MRAAADAPAQLVQLRQAKTIRIIDKHDGGIRHVHAHLYHRSCDEQMCFVGAKSSHHGIFFIRTHAAMQQSHGLIREDAFPMLQLRGGRFALRSLAIFNQRGDDIDLAPGIELRTHKSYNAFGIIRIAQGRNDFATACGQLVYNRHIQITVQGQRERAGNGRGRHHQHIGMIATVDEGLSLHHTELVLLIDNRQPQVCRAILLVKQRMGTHNDTGRRVSTHLRQIIRIIRSRTRAQRYAHIHPFQQAAEIVVMLLCQNLRGCNHGRHVSTLHCQ